MANFILPEEPQYNSEMRMLEPTDPGHADVFNPLFARLLENGEYLSRQIGKGLSCKILGGEELSEEAVEADPEAQFPVVKKAQGVEDVLLFSQDVPELALGAYTVVVRCKCSACTGSQAMLRFSASYINGEECTLLKTVAVTPEMFAQADRYQAFSFLVDYEGLYAEEARMRLEAALLASDTPRIVCVDYVLVNYAYGAITSLG